MDSVPGGSDGKRICLQCRRPGFNPWNGKNPWRKTWLPTPVFWPGEFHGLYSPWGHKESDAIELPSTNAQVILDRRNLGCLIFDSVSHTKII